MSEETVENSFEIANSPLLSDALPKEIINAQNEISSNNEEEQKHSSKVNLFFSFDIVNSTIYKQMTANWPLVIRGLLEDIRARIIKIPELSHCFLWRVIGDEMVYVLSTDSEEELKLAVDSIFEVTQKISISLKSGKFFDLLIDQSLQKGEINILKTQNRLSIKTTAWIAVINEKLISPYDNISFLYSASSNNQILREYLGRDIDAGFRLKAYTQDRRLIINVELACLLAKWGKHGNLHILDYVKLKGVWNETLYPIIWYYDEKIVSRCYKELTGEYVSIPFASSFRFDETDNNELVNKYFKRGKTTKKEKSNQFGEFQLSPTMYKSVERALKKIVSDRNLQQKIDYIEKLLSGNIQMKRLDSFVYPLEMHCAVVCCDIEEKKVLITQRCAERTSNPGKWEFGCAKATSDKPLVESIVDYYQITFGIEIELVKDSSRSEKQPKTIAVYEIVKGSNIKKGVIFVAKVKKKITSDQFRPESSHNCIRWISKEEVEMFDDSSVITDFKNTLNYVFANFSIFFDLENR